MPRLGPWPAPRKAEVASPAPPNPAQPPHTTQPPPQAIRHPHDNSAQVMYPGQAQRPTRSSLSSSELSKVRPSLGLSLPICEAMPFRPPDHAGPARLTVHAVTLMMLWARHFLSPGPVSPSEGRGIWQARPGWDHPWPPYLTCHRCSMRATYYYGFIFLWIKVKALVVCRRIQIPEAKEIEFRWESIQIWGHSSWHGERAGLSLKSGQP